MNSFSVAMVYISSSDSELSSLSRWHGASGFLAKKIAKNDESVAANNGTDKDWDAFSKLCSKTSKEDVTFGQMHWASIYLANTPQQAAELGLKFSGVDEVNSQPISYIVLGYLKNT